MCYFEIKEGSDFMGTITVRLNPDEQRVFSEYAKLNGMPLSTLFKKIMEERIEDEFDMKCIKEYENDVKDRNTQTVDHDELKKMLGL